MCPSQVSADFETVLFRKQEGIGYVTINRPRSLNIYNLQMRDDLYEVLGAIREDLEIRVVIMDGAGEKAFCAGADLSEFLSAPSPVIARQVRWERDVWGLFLDLPQPVIAALHGFVLGSGIEMALCSDIRIASADVRFRLPESSLGIIPAAGGTQTLPRTIGQSRSMEMLLVGKWMNAEEALDAGLVNMVVDRDRLLDTARQTAMEIMSGAPAAVRSAKEALVRGSDMGLAEGLSLERRLNGALLSTSDAREGVMAHLQGRPPAFGGR